MLADDARQPHQIDQPAGPRVADAESALDLRLLGKTIEVPADLVVLAVKPQVLPAVLDDLDGQIPPQAAVLAVGKAADAMAVVRRIQAAVEEAAA